MHCAQVLTMSLLVTSFAMAPGCAAEAPEYSMSFKNATNAEITDAGAHWRRHNDPIDEIVGVLSPDADKGMHQELRPIPEKVTVMWKTADGKSHTQDVIVAKLIPDPATFSGRVYFKFNSDGTVTVVPLTYDQIDKLAADQKKYP